VHKTMAWLVAGVGLLVVPSIASAHAGNVDPTAVHACIAKGSALVRIVGVRGSCSPTETPAHWAAAVTRAAGPCFDNENRYVDCGNGTITDGLTGLIWLKQAACLGDADWKTANERAAGLKSGDCSLTDGSSQGDWRLPTRDELAEMTVAATFLQCTQMNGPALTNDQGTACYSTGPSSLVVPGFPSLALSYWSATPYIQGYPATPSAPDKAWYWISVDGGISVSDKSYPWSVWPVRRPR